MFVFKGDGIINDFYGNYSEYRDLQKNEEKQNKFEEKKKKIQNKKIDKRKVSYLSIKVLTEGQSLVDIACTSNPTHEG